jgi:hypothetical protein
MYLPFCFLEQNVVQYSSCRCVLYVQFISLSFMLSPQSLSDEDCKLWISSICNFLYPTCSLLGRNAFFSILFSDTSVSCNCFYHDNTLVQKWCCVWYFYVRGHPLRRHSGTGDRIFWLCSANSLHRTLVLTNLILALKYEYSHLLTEPCLCTLDRNHPHTHPPTHTHTHTHTKQATTEWESTAKIKPNWLITKQL